MGLTNQIRAGAAFNRSTVSFTGDISGVGSVNLRSTYMLLSIRASSPCRIRLYDNQSSRDDATEISRIFGDTNIPDSIALIGDFNITAADTTYTIDPVLFGLVNDPSTELTYYRIDGASEPVVQVTTYPLEDRLIIAAEGSPYELENRRTLPAIAKQLNAGEIVSGTLFAESIPQTYLLISASLDNIGHSARLRLYSVSSSLDNTQERTRSFVDEPSGSLGLIVDMNLVGTQTTYFVPKIVGANIKNMGTNLDLLRSDRSRMVGDSALYYFLQNTGGSSATISASLHVYSLEEFE